MKYPLLGCALLAAVAATPVQATKMVPAVAPANVSVGALKIEDAFTRPTPGGAKVAVGYVTIVNGGAADRLVSVTSGISASAEIHESKMENGVMEMRELTDGLPIPAGTTVALKPGGDHIMFVDLNKPVKPGDTINATLTFEKAGKVDVGFKAAASMGATSPGGDMGGMKMQ